MHYDLSMWCIYPYSQALFPVHWDNRNDANLATLDIMDFKIEVLITFDVQNYMIWNKEWFFGICV